MEMQKDSLPDYSCWSKLDTWTLKDAALLLHALDPLEYRQVKFNLREVPNATELKDAYKTFLILNNVTRNQRYSDNSGILIEIIYAVVEQKELPIPKELKALLDKRFQRKQETQQAAIVNHPFNKETSTRERRNFLKQIGLIVHVLMDTKHPRYQFLLSDRVNAFSIAQAMLDKAKELDVGTEGLKSCNRKIAEALEFLEEEVDS
jgi:hypothetical protein